MHEDEPAQLMTFNEVDQYFQCYGDPMNKHEADFLKSYRALERGRDELEDILREIAGDLAKDLKVTEFVADLEAYPTQSDWCDDEGVSGFVALRRFCGLYFVVLAEYGECGEEFGPYRERISAERVFQDVVSSRICDWHKETNDIDLEQGVKH